MRTITLSIMMLFIGAVKAIALQPTLTTPKGWEKIADPTQLPNKVKCIFVGSGKSSFTPSINLAQEETSSDIATYVNLAKQYHEGQGDTSCTLLGNLQTRAGVAQVLQIDRLTQWGKIRFIQGILLIDKYAYVITSTCTLEDFAALSSLFFKTIQSFALIAE